MGRVMLFIRLGLLIHSSYSRGCLNVSWIRLLIDRFVMKALVAYGRFVYALNSPTVILVRSLSDHITYITLLAIVPH